MYYNQFLREKNNLRRFESYGNEALPSKPAMRCMMNLNVIRAMRII